MAKAWHSLSDRRRIQQIHRSRQVKRSRHMQVKMLHQPTGQRIQMAIIVSTKVAKQATARNRIRRRLKAALTNLIDQLSPGCDLLVVVTDRGIEELGFDELQAELSGCLRALGALN